MKVFAKAYWAAMLGLTLAFFLAVLVLIVNGNTGYFGGNDVYIYFLSLFILFCLVNNAMVFAVIAVPFFMLVNKVHQFSTFYALLLGILVGLGNYGGVFVLNGRYLGLDLDHIAALPWWVSAGFIFGLIFAGIYAILARAKIAHASK